MLPPTETGPASELALPPVLKQPVSNNVQSLRLTHARAFFGANLRVFSVESFQCFQYVHDFLSGNFKCSALESSDEATHCCNPRIARSRRQNVQHLQRYWIRLRTSSAHRHQHQMPPSRVRKYAACPGSFSDVPKQSFLVQCPPVRRPERTLAASD